MCRTVAGSSLSACCGVAVRYGDLGTSGRIAYRTIDRLREAAPRALSWCPTCQIQLTEVVDPGRIDDPLDMNPIVKFLAERLDDLRPLMPIDPVNKVWLNENDPGGLGDRTRLYDSGVRPALDFRDGKRRPDLAITVLC